MSQQPEETQQTARAYGVYVDENQKIHYVNCAPSKRRSRAAKKSAGHPASSPSFFTSVRDERSMNWAVQLFLFQMTFFGQSAAAAAADDPHGGTGDTMETAFADDPRARVKARGISSEEFEQRKAQCQRAEFRDYTAQEDYFLLAGGEAIFSEDRAAIQVDIPCQLGTAELRFDFWTNSYNVTVKVCQELTGQQPICDYMVSPENPLNVTIPGSGEPFRLYIESRGLSEEAIILIDNIRYDGQLCEVDAPNNGGAKPFSLSITPSKQPGNTATTAKSDASVDFEVLEPGEAPIFTSSTVSEKDTKTYPICRALPCNFNDGAGCHYSMTGIGSTSRWQIGQKFIGNKLTGVHVDDFNEMANEREAGYAFVGSDYEGLQDEVFVMESPRFAHRENSYLVFDLFLRSFGPQLRVCIDSFDYCPYSNPAVNKTKYWFVDQRVFLPPGMKKVYFIAGKVKRHHFLAIDNIRLQKESGGDPCANNDPTRLYDSFLRKLLKI
ncbi:unnamed protein product, partial [Mesorhabditis spiculigera]